MEKVLLSMVVAAAEDLSFGRIMGINFLLLLAVGPVG